MSTGPEDDGRDLPDTTHRMPPSGGPGSRRPVGPPGPPPPPEAFRPAGPPPSADSFRPGQPLDPTGGTPRPGRPDSPAGPTRQDPYGRPYAPASGGYGQGYGDRDRDRERDRGRDWTDASYGASPDLAKPPPPGPTRVQDSDQPRRRRWPKRLAIVAGVLVVLLIVADRVVATVVAPNAMKKQIAVSLAEANTDPSVPPAQVTDVSIGGIPFLTQVFLGNYKDIRLSVAGISTPGPRISEVDARLQGVHVPFADAIRDQVGEVPVDEVQATVRVTYDDLNAWLATATADSTPRNVSLTPVDGGQRVEASFEFDFDLSGINLGAQTVKATSTFSVTDGKLSLDFSEVDVDGTFDLPSIPVGAIPGIELPLPDLPFDLTVVDAGTDASGVSLTARARDVRLPAG